MRALSVLVFAAAVAATAAEPPLAKGKSKSAAKSTAPAAKSVIELTSLAKPAVVVVSHIGRTGSVDGVGAGFVVSSNGLIATCLHVIGEARPVSVQFSDGRKFDVTEVHAWDRKLDLAVVRIAATNLPALSLGDSDALPQGAPVVALGNPRGLDFSVVQGVVSARREIEVAGMIQVAIPIEPGNSGGPLLDLQGRVHGILTLKSALTENLGFAMPANALKSLLDKPNPVPLDRWLTLAALNPREWTPLNGARWTQRAGRIAVEGAGNGFGGRSLLVSQRDVPARPYEVSVTVKLDDEAGAAGLVFESDGGDRHYGFYPSAGRLRLTRFDGPNVFTWHVLKEVATPHYRPGDWNTLKVRVEKDRTRCFVNGQLVAETDDDELPAGKVGLAKFRDTQALFKNFAVGRDLPSAAPPPDVVARVLKQVEGVGATGPLDAKTIENLQPHADLVPAILAERAKRLQAEAKQLQRLALAVHHSAVQSDLVKLFAQADARVDLLHAALLLAKLDNPELDVDAYRRQFDALAQEARTRLAAAQDERSRMDALVRFVFTDCGFHGSRTDYYNRANSHINEVLDDREGLPITLAVVFMELARRAGIDGVQGIPLPGHFVVNHKPAKGEPQLLDLFEGGQPLSHRDAERMVLLNTGEPAQPAHFEPASSRDIIVRMTRNLISAANRSGPGDPPLRYLEIICALEPGSARDRLNRGLLRAQAGDTAGARDDLLFVLEKKPAGIDLDRVEEVLRRLQREK
jgi:regulator of sirC expression with transglutaminase-like and TPR domain